jgi:hypothetical protein
MLCGFVLFWLYCTEIRRTRRRVRGSDIYSMCERERGMLKGVMFEIGVVNGRVRVRGGCMGARERT